MTDYEKIRIYSNILV